MGLKIFLRHHAPLLRLVGLFVLVFPGTGCAGTIQGQVVDAQTSQPIAGAIVLGVWTKVAGLPGLHHHELVGVQEVETDAEGRFMLERPRRIIYEDDESVTVYKPGYVAWNNLIVFPNSVRRKDTRLSSQIILERFPSGKGHQRHVSFISGATRGKDNPETTPKFWNAVRPEHFLP